MKGNITVSEFPSGLVGKNGQRIYEDDVIYDGKDYYRRYWNPRFPQVEAISPTNGYLHDLTQKDLSRFERTGPFEEHQELMIVD